MDVREKLVELLAEAGLGKAERYFLADHLIAHGVTVQEWISVKDRLPEKDGDYLIYATVPFNGRKFMAVMHYEEDAHLPIWSDTTHWMPLPEPPKGE